MCVGAKIAAALSRKWRKRPLVETLKMANKSIRRFLLLASCFAASSSAFSVGNSQRVFISTPSKTEKIVADLMTSEPHLFTLSPDTKVDDAISQLVSYSISSAPVVERLKDAETNQVFNRLVGFVSSFDFLPREETGSLVTLGETKDAVARRILGRTVEDVMTRDPITVTTNQNMKEAAEVMAGHRLHALPVVDAKHGHCVGIITAEDVMRDVMKTARGALPADLAA